MFTQQPHDVGVPSFRDESYKERGTPIGARWVQYAHRIKSIDPTGLVDRDKSTGDILGAMFAKAADRLMGSWWHGCPVIKKGGGFKPIRDRSFGADDGYELIDAAVKDGATIPDDAIGIIYAASKEDGEQELIFLPSSGGGVDLMAPNRNGDYETGTNVYDLDDTGKPDQANFAKLQSAWIPMSPSYAPTSGSTGTGGHNFFAMAAVGAWGLAPGGLSLKPAESTNANNGIVNVGILPGKPKNPFGDGGGGNVGVNVQGKLKFTQVEGDQGGFNPTSGLSGGGIQLPIIPGGGSTGGGGGSGIVGATIPKPKPKPYVNPHKPGWQPGDGPDSPYW